MATHVEHSDLFLSLQERNVLLNAQISAFKKTPGDINSILRDLVALKADFQRAVSNQSPQDATHIQILNIALSKTEAKVLKIQSKLPVQPVYIPAQQSPMTPEQQMASRASTYGFISFYLDSIDALTGCFGNFHTCPNLIEFGGFKYSNSEALFQAQKYTDQPHIFSQFTAATDGDTAVKIAHHPSNKMTPKRDAEWKSNTPHVNSVDVMMNVLRAKFGQNPELKKMLLATGNAYLVEHNPVKNRDAFWSDDHDGTGKNMLGICLMRLRAEYGGSGIVPSVPNCNRFIGATSAPVQQSSSNTLCNRCQQRPKNFDQSLQRLHDYCSRTCAVAAQTAASSLQGRVCKRSGCGKPSFVETSGRVHDYCSKSCARLDGAM